MRVFLLFAVTLGSGCGGEVSLGNLTPTDLPTDSPTDSPVPSQPPTVPTEAAPPVAVCGVSKAEVVPFHESVDFIGSDSYDPNGLPITAYHWRLIATPMGSSVEMPDGGAERTEFTTDQLGEYVAQLTVVNSAGLESDPCVVAVDASAPESLWIELWWDKPGDDMDLHLLSPGGAFMDEFTDCYYGTCRVERPPLDWGIPNFDDDNPILDQDDQTGVGPENINLLSPQNGVYTVLVRDWGNNPGIASTSVTANVWVNGLLAWTGTKVIAGDPQQPIEFAEVDWPTGVVTSLL